MAQELTDNSKISLSPSDETAEPFIHDDEVFIRMTLAERLQHVVLMICFVLLVLTGLPLLIDPSVWLHKIFSIENSFAWRGLIHRTAGTGLIILSIYHLFYVSCTRRGREIFRALMPVTKDITDVLEAFGHNLGFTRWLHRRGYFKDFLDRHPYWLFTEPPQFGRYNFIEKLEYLSVWWGNFVMIISGFFLWAKNLSFRLFPIWVYDIFKLVHSYEAVLAFLAILIWHLYNVHLSPEVFPMSKVWINGKITGYELRKQHPLEYREILIKRMGRKS